MATWSSSHWETSLRRQIGPMIKWSLGHRVIGIPHYADRLARSNGHLVTESLGDLTTPTNWPDDQMVTWLSSHWETSLRRQIGPMIKWSLDYRVIGRPHYADRLTDDQMATWSSSHWETSLRRQIGPMIKWSLGYRVIGRPHYADRLTDDQMVTWSLSHWETSLR